MYLYLNLHFYMNNSPEKYYFLVSPRVILQILIQ